MMTSESSDMFPVVIERRLVMRSASSATPVELAIEIGHPYWTVPNVEAACPVAIRGGIGRVNDIRGIDPMNAMKLAIRFVENYLGSSPDGQKYFWLDGEKYEDD